MQRIGLIGAGHIGSTIARLATGTGHQIILSNSRGPETLSGLADQIGPHVIPGTTQDAAAADVVVITIPLHAFAKLPDDLDARLAGKVVLDTMNYYPDRDGHIPALDQHTTTTADLTAQGLPSAHIVKALNNIVAPHLLRLARRHGNPERSTLPIASNDPAAKAAAAALIDELGYDTLDTGPLDTGWRFENGQPAYCLPYAADPVALRNSAPDDPPLETRTVTAPDLQAALDQATHNHTA